MISIGTANEKGTIVITCAFTDEDGDPVVPTTIKWTLTDGAGDVINEREQVSVLVPAATTYIVLSGDDLELEATDTSQYVNRYFLIEATYTSTYGTNLPLRDSTYFKIENLRYIE